MHVDPATLAVTLHPLATDRSDPSLAAFAATTRPTLRVPGGVAEADVKRWLRQRYDAYAQDYSWVP
jgi:hypothetical protein